MSDIKISQLPAAGTLDGTELVPMVQTGATVKTTAQDIANLSAGSGGTVTAVSVTTANGVSGTVANPTTTPAISLTLGAITPTTVVASGAISGSNLSGTNTGDQTITLTGPITGSGTGTLATTVAANVIANTNLAQMATHTVKGNATGGTANAADLTGTQVTALLDPFTTSLQGVAPASGGGTSNFLRADGTWATPAGGGSGTVTTVSVVTANGVSGTVANATTTPAITLALGSITPSAVAAAGTVTGSNLSGTNTGDQTITLTGQVTGSGTGSFATTIASNTVTNSNLAQMATHTIKGNVTGGTANAADLTGTQATTLLDAFTSTLKGLTPASGGGTTNFLRADGTWQAPAGGGSVTSVAVSGGTTGLTTSGGPITGAGTITLAGTLGAANGGTGVTSLGNLTDAGTDGIVVTGGTGALITSASIAQHVADTTHNGYLSSTDWNTFNGKGSGTVTSVSVSGGTTGLTTSGSPITGSGTITLAGTLAVANGGTGVTTSTGTGNVVLSTSPTFVTPILGTPTSVTLTNGTGLPIIAGTTGTLSVARGGTNSVAALNNNRVIQSSGGAIVEAAAIGANFALASDTNGIPIASVTTTTELGYSSGVTSAIQTQLNGKQATGNYITALTSDVTATGPGSVAATIAVGAVTDTKGSLATKPAVAVAATTNQALSGTPTIDGVATAAGTLILLTAQSTASQNGPWVAAAGAWSRPTWYPSGGTTQAFQFITTLVRLGAVYQGSTWRITSSGAVTIDTTATTWSVVTLSSGGLTPNLLLATVGLTIDGGGSTITTGVKGYTVVPYGATITGWTLLADQTGSAVVDVWKVAYSSYPPTVGNTITSATPPTISSAQKGQNLAVSGWTTAVTAGDTFGFNVNSCTSITRLTLVIQMTRT